jgi:hypothetical protein
MLLFMHENFLNDILNALVPGIVVYPCNPSYLGGRSRRMAVGKSYRDPLSQKQTRNKRTGGMAQVVEHLPTQSSNPSTAPLSPRKSHQCRGRKQRGGRQPQTTHSLFPKSRHTAQWYLSRRGQGGPREKVSMGTGFSQVTRADIGTRGSA